MTWRAPFFDLRSGLFVPCVVTWNPETGEFTRVEGPEGFATWEEAEEVSLAPAGPPSTHSRNLM